MGYGIEITKGGLYPSVKYTGNKSNLMNDGVIIDTPNEVVFIRDFQVSKTRTPLTILRSAGVFIETYHVDDYWGDGVNLRQPRLHVRYYYSTGCHLELPYEEFHVDSVLQAFAVANNGWTLNSGALIHDVKIDYLEVDCDDPQASVIMLSEFNRYENFSIGTEYLRLNVKTPFWINANNLSRSVIGGQDVDIYSGSIKPSILIQDRPKQGKYSQIRSDDNVFINLPNLELGRLGQSPCCLNYT